MKEFIIGVGYVEREPEKSIATGWDRAFAAVRAQYGAGIARPPSRKASVAVSWDSAFARIQPPRAGRL
jgi:hypothetical protein